MAAAPTGTPPGYPLPDNPEWHNPARRYKYFRPRQARRGAITLATPTNHATLSLYNEGKGAQVLVVCAFAVAPATAKTVDIALQQGAQGSAGGLVVPIVSGDTNSPGTLYSLDTATLLTPDFLALPQVNLSYWPYSFPLAVLQPGWSLSFQDSTAAEAMSLAIMWEAIYPEELDWSY